MQSEQINVKGTTCGGCTSSVTKALKAINGIDNVILSLSDANAIVQYDEKLTSPEQMKAAIKEVGYGIDVSNSPQQPAGKGCCK